MSKSGEEEEDEETDGWVNMKLSKVKKRKVSEEKSSIKNYDGQVE